MDPKKSAAENAYDIYAMLCLEETRDTKRLFLLNALASLCLAASTGSPNNNLRFTTEELLYWYVYQLTNCKSLLIDVPILA